LPDQGVETGWKEMKGAKENECGQAGRGAGTQALKNVRTTGVHGREKLVRRKKGTEDAACLFRENVQGRSNGNCEDETAHPGWPHEPGPNV